MGGFVRGAITTPPAETRAPGPWRARAGRIALGVLGLSAAACGDLLPSVELGSSTTDVGPTTTATSTTGIEMPDSTGTATTGPESSSTGESTGGTTTLADSSTGPVVPGCGNGLIEPGEVCYSEPVEIALIPHALCEAALGDVFGQDGHLDLLVSPCSQSSLRILEGSAAGLSSTVATRELGPGIDLGIVRDLALGDYSGDGRTDVLLPDAPMSMTLFTDVEQNPIVDFQAIPTLAGFFFLLPGEFGGTPGVDLVAGTSAFEEVYVFRGTGAPGTPLEQIQSFAPGLINYQGMVTDIDGDAQTDLILSRTIAPPRIEIYRGVDDGLDTSPQIFPIEDLFGVVAGQFDGEPGHDLLVARVGTDEVIPFSSAGGIAVTPGASLPTGPGEPRLMAALDLDNDGLDDLVSTQQVGGGNHLVLSLNEETSFAMERMHIIDTERTSDGGKFLLVDDLNEDGVPDIVVVTVGSRILQLLSDP